MWECEIDEIRNGQRIQEGLVGLFPDVLPSRKSCRKALDAGRVTVVRHGKEWKASTALLLQAGDVIQLVPPFQKTPAPRWKPALTIGHEDDTHAVVWKPAGMPTSGSKGLTFRAALTSALTRSSAPDAMAQPEPVHRLDKATAGWLLVAKSYSAAHALSKQVAPGGSCIKRYDALCSGVVPVALNVNVPLDGQTARTKIVRFGTGIYQGSTASWLRLQLYTGRTHQIRRHLHGLGHPLKGDALYGGDSGSLMLVCTELIYQDPNDGEFRTVTSTLPKRFRRIPWVE